VTPALLVWARETCGLSLDVAAKRVGVPTERLSSWEEGAAQPTITQARKLASVYRRSFAILFLPERPESRRPPVRDFRRLPGTALGEYSPEILADIRSALDRRDVLIELLAGRGTQMPGPLPDMPAGLPTEDAGLWLRQLLQTSLDRQVSWADSRISFNAWRERFEDLGLLVFQAVETPIVEARAFAIDLRPLPAIVVNRKDAYAGRVFSLFHELTHLLNRTSALCQTGTDTGLPPEEQRIEVFCNAVAAAALLPAIEFIAAVSSIGVRASDWSLREVDALAKRFKVSPNVIARRLLTLREITQAKYEQYNSEIEDRFAKLPRRKGFIPPPINTLSAAGKPFVRAVLDAWATGQITTSDATDYLGLRTKHFDALMRAVTNG